MACVSAPGRGTTVDLSPLGAAVRETCSQSGSTYRDAAVEAGVPFPKVLRLANDAPADVDALELVNLSRWAGVPLSDLAGSFAPKGGPR